jgi:nucleotide-binding universal stress UspA family protein
MKRILVATDFSTRSDRALRRAVLLAGAHGAALTLVHVVDDDQPADLVGHQARAARALLEQTARTIGEVDAVPAEIVVTTGDPFAGILAAADAAEPDLIVVGPHRRQFLDTFVGTTAERTIRRGSRPVLMANAVPGSAYQRSLLAIDFDEASQGAVQAARRLGMLGGTDIMALHLFDAAAVGMMKRAMEDAEAIDAYMKEEERRARAELTAYLLESGLEGARQILRPRQGPAPALIRDCAAEVSADLIVMGTNQRRGLHRFLLGSVAQEVLLDAAQDVLVVPLDKPQ